MDRLRRPLFEAQLADDLVDAVAPFRLLGVLREAEFGRVAEGPAHGQLRVQDVVLRHQADALAQFGVVAVQVAAVVQDRALVGGAQPGQRVEQRGLARAARAHDGEQALLADRERDVIEERLAAPVHGDRQALDVERDLTGVDELLQRVADQAERGVADAHDVPGRDPGAGDRCAVEVGAVVRAEVDDLVRAVGPRPQLGVTAGDGQVVDHEVVVGAAAEVHGPGGQRPHGRRLPERAGRAGHGDG